MWEWLTSEDAGNFGQMLGSVLTGGSLLLGFYLLLRERWSRERAQADRVITYLKHVPYEPEHNQEEDWRVVVRNTSDQPIYGLFQYETDSPWRPGQWRSIGVDDDDNYITNMFPPNHQATVLIEGLLENRKAKYYICFLDARSKLWAREVRTQKYKRYLRLVRSYYH